MKRVLILGGGAGGVVVASRLSRMLKGKASITLVDRNRYHEFRPSYLWVAMGIREPDGVRRELALLERKGVGFLNGTVRSIDASNRRVGVEVNGGTRMLDYDYLVVSLGAELRPEMLKGMEHAHHTWELGDAVRFRDALAGFKGGRVVVGVASTPYRCPPAPFELALMLRYLSEQRGVDDRTEISVFHPAWSVPMEPFGPFMQRAFGDFLVQHRITFHGNWRIDHIDGERRRIIADNGDVLEYDLAVVIPPHVPSTAVAASDLADKATGYMDVRRKNLRSSRYDDVFGLGDIIAPTLGIGMAGVFAHFEGDYIATQIADELSGAYMAMNYNRSGICVMDIGYMGTAVFCDFSKVLAGEARYPDCWMLGGMKAFRGIKMAFERMWFAEIFGR
ncbi:MAG: FAD/NAD(P)-binding oxidoreductase [Candidatus Nitrosocaldus sp.]|nr:NAD(P)/FAD-dependent oxidoreductase [Candidatus Nitrosocaldus sp.]MDW8274848.1 FAD/NAD(P)-binding oxidoreductase [Candidatus Nitrosocaldus sp.]